MLKKLMLHVLHQLSKKQVLHLPISLFKQCQICANTKTKLNWKRFHIVKFVPSLFNILNGIFKGSLLRERWNNWVESIFSYETLGTFFT